MISPPSRSTIVLIAAIISSGFWFVSTVLGDHPDGSLLGFGGTLFSIYALTEREWRDREDREARRRLRRHSRPSEEDESPDNEDDGSEDYS